MSTWHKHRHSHGGGDPWTCTCGETYPVPSLAAECAAKHDHDDRDDQGDQ